MSKTYSAKNSNKNNWITRQWYNWLEVLLIRICLPISLFYLCRNLVKFFTQRSIIKKTLKSSQQLVDELDESGFYIDIINLWLFKFRTYALDNIQIITEQMNTADNMHPEVLTRLIVSNIKEVLKSRGGDILDNTSMRILQPSDKVLLIRLHPISMTPSIISFKDLAICLVINGLGILSYFYLYGVLF